MKTFVSALRQSLTEVATAERAQKEKLYLKSDLEHLGVTVPVMRQTAKAHLARLAGLDHDTLWRLVDALWSEPVFELRSAAVEILVAKPKLLTAADIAPAIERLIRESKTWALVDTLAVTVAGNLVTRFDETLPTLDRWAVDDDFWLRRSAMLALLKPLRRGAGDFDRFAAYADTMLEEKEFFIRKAIGWILRESSRKQPDRVTAWIAPRIGRASGVTVREAVKYLPDKDALMAAYRATH